MMDNPSRSELNTWKYFKNIFNGERGKNNIRSQYSDKNWIISVLIDSVWLTFVQILLIETKLTIKMYFVKIY